MESRMDLRLESGKRNRCMARFIGIVSMSFSLDREEEGRATSPAPFNTRKTHIKSQQLTIEGETEGPPDGNIDGDEDGFGLGWNVGESVGFGVLHSMSKQRKEEG